METRARFLLLGFFVLAVFFAGFGFVYWLNHAGTLGEQSLYRIRFDGTVSGLRPGSAVLFNGIRVGEVRTLELSPEEPRSVLALISVDRRTPVRGDTSVQIYTQGLMGSPAISLLGGDRAAKPLAAPSGAEPAILDAPPGAGEDMMQAAREALGRLDKILVDNAGPLRDTIANLKSFTDALARNSDRVDSIAQGLEKTFGGAEKAKPTPYDLTPPAKVTLSRPLPAVQIAITEPTTILKFDTQRILASTDIAPDGFFESAQWSDSLPKLFHAGVVQSFENAGFGGLAREEAGIEADYRLLIDLRSVRLVKADELRGEVEFGARLVDRDGRIAGFRIFRAAMPSAGTSAADAAAAINAAFGETMTALVGWTMDVVSR